MQLFLILYNTLVVAVLGLLCPLWIALVGLREKYRQTFFQRLWMAPLTPGGEKNGNDPIPATIWIHALSVGEVLSAESLVKALARKHGSANLVFTASTHTGIQMAQRIIAPYVRAVRHFPYDMIFSVKRAVAVLRPRMVVIVETDLWPNVLYHLNRKAVPVYLVNARLSDRSHRGYRRVVFLMGPLLSIPRRIGVQSENDRRRFLDLGVHRQNIIVTGNLKFDQSPVTVGEDEREQLSAALGIRAGKPAWVAGSTHPHEEEILGKAFRRLREAGMDLTLIIAPRDPKRATDVCEVFRRLEIQATTMGQHDAQNRSSAVVVIDRLGILRQLYALADVTFVGGSLVKAGGHNPLEPASVAKPILFGPYTDDFAWICRMLENEGGGIRVPDGIRLSAMIQELLMDEAKRIQIGEVAYSIFKRHQGAVARTLNVMAS